MPRDTNSQQVNVILGLIDAAGGKIAHNDLVAKLNSGGHNNLPAQLINLAQTSQLQVRAEKQPNGEIIAVYSRRA